jgi:hypothetical protein
LFGPLAALCLLLALPHHQALTGEKPDPKARAFRFTVTGDNTPHRDIFHHVLSEMKRCLGSEGAFHISVGDYSTASETFSDLTAVLGKKVRWHPVVGNHDLADKNIAWLRRHFERFPKHVNRGPKNAEKTTYSFVLTCAGSLSGKRRKRAYRDAPEKLQSLQRVRKGRQMPTVLYPW